MSSGSIEIMVMGVLSTLGILDTSPIIIDGHQAKVHRTTRHGHRQDLSKDCDYTDTDRPRLWHRHRLHSHRCNCCWTRYVNWIYSSSSRMRVIYHNWVNSGFIEAAACADSILLLLQICLVTYGKLFSEHLAF